MEVIVEKEDREKLVVTNKDKTRRIVFAKHEYLPGYLMTFDFKVRTTNKDDLKFTRDVISWIFNETPCIMIRFLTDSTTKTKMEKFISLIPFEQFDENKKARFFRCGIQYWINTNDGKGYDLSKAIAKGK